MSKSILSKSALSILALTATAFSTSGFAATTLPLGELFDKAQAQTKTPITEVTLDESGTRTQYRFTSFGYSKPNTLILDAQDGSLTESITPDIDLGTAIDTAERIFSGEILSVSTDIDDRSELIYVIEVAQADSIIIAEMDSQEFQIIHSETLDEEYLEAEEDYTDSREY
ncbi:hypothetical protein [Aliamphritea ceti]|uniref:hypothetical protein n=1 Tax=Aliamphritea ceti TaxID=1524258 RepID=UPI0021C48D2E|nr:hypothetical protein [Aliamphritea ceti]